MPRLLTCPQYTPRRFECSGKRTRPSNPQVVLRPQDLVVLLRLALESGPAPSYAALGAELGMTASEAHAAVERAVSAQLAI